ncbi:MAG TPA: DUF411 domain-containing protein [Luteimonas sp.]
MNPMNAAARLALTAGALLLAACSAAHSPPATAAEDAGPAAPEPTATTATAAIRAAHPGAAAPARAPLHSPAPDAGSGLLVVHKNANCGCCVVWIEHMRKAGFAVEVHDHEDMGPIKERNGVPYAKGSCHTAEIDGYFVEGHVPPADVKRLLAERPDARGITVPGMPAGSPGMEMPDGTVHPYSVELVHRDGSTTEYARHGE